MWKVSRKRGEFSALLPCWFLIFNMAILCSFFSWNISKIRSEEKKLLLVAMVCPVGDRHGKCGQDGKWESDLPARISADVLLDVSSVLH